MSQLITSEYNNETIEFDISPDNVMVNATEMGKIFGKLPKDFLGNDSTKSFVNECLKKENSPYLGVKNVDDLYTSTQKSGTWMHRVLALKFAAWLDPSFELWVYRTIDDLIFGEYKRLKNELTASAKRKQRIEELEMELGENEHFKELQELKTEERRSAYRRGKVIKNQLQLFQEQI